MRWQFLLVGGLRTCLAFVVEIKPSPHTDPGLDKVYGVGFPSTCVGMQAYVCWP